MAAPFFLDTNIVVYAHDARDSKKQRVAQGILKDALLNGTGVISSQVVQEFCNVMLRPDQPFMREGDLADVLSQIMAPLMRQRPSLDFYLKAIRLFIGNSLSYYDALIVQAALDLGCKTLYSEDLQTGHQYGELTVVNPFQEDGHEMIR